MQKSPWQKTVLVLFAVLMRELFVHSGIIHQIVFLALKMLEWHRQFNAEGIKAPFTGTSQHIRLGDSGLWYVQLPEVFPAFPPPPDGSDKY